MREIIPVLLVEKVLFFLYINKMDESNKIAFAYEMEMEGVDSQKVQSPSNYVQVLESESLPVSINTSPVVNHFNVEPEECNCLVVYTYSMACICILFNLIFAFFAVQQIRKHDKKSYIKSLIISNVGIAVGIGIIILIIHYHLNLKSKE